MILFMEREDCRIYGDVETRLIRIETSKRAVELQLDTAENYTHEMQRLYRQHQNFTKHTRPAEVQ